MKTSDIIYQLQSIREDSAERASYEDEPDNVWANDVAALDAAIDRLQGQPKRTESALTIFGLTAILGFIAAFAGIVLAVVGHTTAGIILLLAATGWWMEALIAGRDCK
ncbi:MAG: hypothetical protein LIO95_10090 [Clostridiales bacterium]|nr:hypothetical protein [Clostridiales bacterium]